MELLLDALVTAISLIFLSILGIISGVAIPGLFMAVVAPWLDWILPVRKQALTPPIGEKGPSASLAPSAARSTYREYASRGPRAPPRIWAFLANRLASGHGSEILRGGGARAAKIRDCCGARGGSSMT